MVRVWTRESVSGSRQFERWLVRYDGLPQFVTRGPLSGFIVEALNEKEQTWTLDKITRRLSAMELSAFEADCLIAVIRQRTREGAFM